MWTLSSRLREVARERAAKFWGRNPRFLKRQPEIGSLSLKFERYPSQTERAFRDALRCRAGYRVRGQEKADVVRCLVR